LGFPEALSFAIGERFQKTGEPKDMNIIHNGGQGVWQEGRMIEPMSQKGMIKSTLGSHITPMVNICRQISENEIEGYNFSMGVMSHLIRSSASGKPGVLTKIGLHTFIDPRHGGGAMNSRSTQKLVELMEIDGEEFLFYKRIRPTLAILRGTTADPDGNITMEKEALYGDAYSCALASKINGGKTIVQVERLSGVPARARDVKIPSILLDYIVVSPDQWQTMISMYNPAYTGELRVPDKDCDAMVERVKELNIQAGRKRERSALHEVIARRASLELIDGALVNLGIGIPEMIPKAAMEMNVDARITLTLEAGVIGGVTSAGIDFGTAFNADMLMDMALLFDL
jgi:propionate CoA-transferase